MNLRIISVGKVKQRFVIDGEQEYLPRLKPWAKVAIEELDPSFELPAPEQMKKEGELFLKKITPGECLIVLDERGKRLTSRALAQYLGERMSAGTSSFTLAIGGAHGWAPEVKQRAQLLLSLSELTFPYQLCRLILVEQLYRALSILKGQPYHK